MVSCANCSTDAQYTYVVSSETVINYCTSHLPNFLTAKKNAGLLKLVVPVPPIVEEAATEEVVEKTAAKKKTATPTE
jgi:hypothetical protein